MDLKTRQIPDALKLRLIPVVVLQLYAVAVIGAAWYWLSTVRATLGRSNEWESWRIVLWGATVFLLATQTRGWMLLTYDNVTGRLWVNDRHRLAASGAEDIAQWIPLLTYSVLFALYLITLGQDPDPLNRFRGPWWFALIGKIIADAITVPLAWIVIRKRLLV